MIKIKLTPVGGYVYGDGVMPEGFDPDQFLIAFAAKVLEARRMELQELSFSDEEINSFIAETKAKVAETILEADVREVDDDKQGLLEIMDAASQQGVAD